MLHLHSAYERAFDAASRVSETDAGHTAEEVPTPASDSGPVTVNKADKHKCQECGKAYSQLRNLKSHYYQLCSQRCKPLRLQGISLVFVAEIALESVLRKKTTQASSVWQGV